MAQPPDVTGLLVAWSHGDGETNDRLIEAVYAEVRALARGYLRRGRPDHSPGANSARARGVSAARRSAPRAVAQSRTTPALRAQSFAR